MKELCIDVSHWDGDINLKSWKHDRGLWGVVIKLGGFERNLGRYVDSRARENCNKAKACGLHMGAYYYSVATSTAQARADAEHFVSLLQGHDFDLPVYYDVEDPAQFELTPRALTDVINTFCQEMQSSGYKAGVYTGGCAWINSMVYKELYKYADWIAAWGPSFPSYAEDGDTIGMWQQGGMRLSDGNIVYDDVPGYQDLDWCYIDYPSIIKGGSQEEAVPSENGTIKRLMELAYDDLGYYAPSDPEPGSKAGRYCAKLMNEDWLAGPSVEIWWCCMWVSMILHKAGVKCPGFPSQNTDVAWNNGAKSKAVSKDSIRRGDILIFDWDFTTIATDHIGFATSFPRNGYVDTIEGNVGNAVKEKVRPLSSIRYVIRPDYLDKGEGGAEQTVIWNPTQNGQKLIVDGIGGYNTIYELQAQLGVEMTGIVEGQDRYNYKYLNGIVSIDFSEIGSKVVMALQAKVGAAIDGIWGKETSTKLQEWLSEKEYSVGVCGSDGYFGHDSVEALQLALNDGVFKE